MMEIIVGPPEKHEFNVYYINNEGKYCNETLIIDKSNPIATTADTVIKFVSKKEYEENMLFPFNRVNHAAEKR